MLTPSPLSPCAALAHAHDHDRYLCALFAGAMVREQWFALFAFNHEISAIAESVSEEMMGFIRFAWWREALDEICAGGEARRHPVVQALAGIVQSSQVDSTRLYAMLDARQEAFAEKKTFDETYFRATSSALFTLCAEVAGIPAAPAIDALGLAWACVGTARASHKAERVSLLTMAREQLANTGGLPELFMPFKDAAGFYLKRLEAGRPTDARARFGLLLTLCMKRMIRKAFLVKCSTDLTPSRRNPPSPS